MTSPLIVVELDAPKLTNNQGEYMSTEPKALLGVKINFLLKMSCDNSRVAQDEISLLLPEDDFLNFFETTDNLQKNVDAIRDVIQCKNNIFRQKKEKHQQILDSQMMKLDNERKEYIAKSEAVMIKMGEAKSQLMQIEHSYFSIRNKLNSEKQTHKELEERIKQLQSDCKQKNAKFYKTSELFSTVISWYKEYLNIGISLEKENPQIVTVTFKESQKNLDGYPYVKLEILDGGKFQILKMHPSMEENSIMKQIIQSHEIVIFLNKFRQHFLMSSKA